MENIKISVVTVCYNAKIFIEDTILSVLSQCYDNIEYIVVDGGSTDGTVDIIHKYIDNITYFISEPDKGIYDAMNKAIRKATGSFINFMNAGDRYADKDVLMKVSKHLTSDVAVVFGDIIISKNHNSYIEKAVDELLYNPNSISMGFNHQASFVNTKLAKENPFDLRYKLAADFNMMSTFHKLGRNFFYCNFPIAIYDNTGVSSVNIAKHRYECMMIVNPSHPRINKLRAELIEVSAIIKNGISVCIRKLFPYLLDKYYSSKSDYKVIE